MYIRQFQFHKGTIRTEIFRMRNRQLQEYFNSIKVRLEHDGETYTSELEIFQFHKGTIRTYSPADALCLRFRISIP